MRDFGALARHHGIGHAARLRATVRDHHGSNTLPPGTKIGHYTILGTLGSGGFGTTYSAQEELTEREVVIKELLPSDFAKRATDARTVLPRAGDSAHVFDEALERFHSDAKMAAGFHHPNLPEVLAYFEANGTAYLVVVSYAGTTLAALLAPDRTLTEPDMLATVRPLLGAVEEMHGCGSLHGAIKPENILIRADKTPMLLGFGATLHRSIREAARGNPAFANGAAEFEQRGTGDADGPWTDVHGLGAVMLRCLAGRPTPPPFVRAEALARGQVDPMATDLALLRQRASTSLAFTVEAALRNRPQDRPQSVEELRRFMTGPATQFAMRRAPPIQRRDEPAATLLLGRASSPKLTNPVPPPSRTGGRPIRRPHMSRSVTIAVASVLSTAAVFYGARYWPPGFHDAPPSLGGSAKIAPVLATPAGPLPQTVESQMRRAEMLQGLAKYHRLMLDAAEGNEARSGDRPAAAAAPPNESAPPPATRPLQAERTAPSAQPTGRFYWHDPGYTAR